ncbi:MAG: pyroglutamyl-peptidase I [Aureliella sp.]
MRILLTAFEPYDDWTQNSSWLALIALLRDRPGNMELVTRRYPVGLAELKKQLDKDLDADFDVVIHTGQAPGAATVKLEAIALNAAGVIEQAGECVSPLVSDAPVGYRSELPIAGCLDALRAANVPSAVSYHAGTFLCNAALFLSQHWFATRGLSTKVGFIHLPLASEQIATSGPLLPSLPTETLAQALRVVLETLAENPQRLA